jgi:hypothetical protein
MSDEIQNWLGGWRIVVAIGILWGAAWLIVEAAGYVIPRPGIFLTVVFYAWIVGMAYLALELCFGAIRFLFRVFSWRPSAERHFSEFQQWQRDHYEQNGLDPGMVPGRNGKPPNPTIPNEGLSPLVELWRRQRGQDKAWKN